MNPPPFKKLSLRQNEMLIKGIKESNIERLKVYLNKYHFSQKELNYICDELCNKSNTSLQLIDLLIEKGLKITSKRYLLLGSQGVKDFSLFKSQYFLKFHHPHNIDLLEGLIFNKPQYLNGVFDFFNQNTDILKEHNKRLLIVAALVLNFDFIEKLIKVNPSLNINIIKKYSKYYKYPKVTSPLYFHRYGAIEYLIHNFCNPHNGIKYPIIKSESKEQYLIKFLNNLKSLGLQFNDGDTLLLVASLNNEKLDLFNYLEKDINPQNLNKPHYLKFIIESVATGFQKPFENLISKKILKIKESYILHKQKAPCNFKLSDYTYLLLSSDGKNNVIKNWNILINNNYYAQIYKELSNLTLNLSQEDFKEEHQLCKILRTQNCFEDLSSPKEILEQIKKINPIKHATHLAIKEELEKIIIKNEKDQLEKTIAINNPCRNIKKKL